MHINRVISQLEIIGIVRFAQLMWREPPFIFAKIRVCNEKLLSSNFCYAFNWISLVFECIYFRKCVFAHNSIVHIENFIIYSSYLKPSSLILVYYSHVFVCHRIKNKENIGSRELKKYLNSQYQMTISTFKNLPAKPP